MTQFRPCVLIPTYDNPDTIREVVLHARRYLADVLVVDDGSSPDARAACERLAAESIARVRHRERNGGKGAAVKDGLRWAHELGFTHAVQVDADGQHDTSLIPRFVEIARAAPQTLVLGYPIYDESLNRGRYAARLVTRFWNYVEVQGPTIADSMCGFRVYPIEAALAANARGDRMDFDVEIPVRMVWNGVAVHNEPIPVRYLSPEQGGVSHYRLWGDTVRISWVHTRLMLELIFLRTLLRPFRPRTLPH